MACVMIAFAIIMAIILSGGIWAMSAPMLRIYQEMIGDVPCDGSRITAGVLFVLLCVLMGLMVIADVMLIFGFIGHLI